MSFLQQGVNVLTVYSRWTASIPRYRDHGEKLTPFEYVLIIVFFLFHFSNCFHPTSLLNEGIRGGGGQGAGIGGCSICWREAAGDGGDERGSERCREEVSLARHRGGVGGDARGKWTREDLS